MIGVFSRRPALRSTTKSADHVVVLARRLEATQPNDGLRSAFDRLRLEHLTAVTWNTDHVIANAIALMSQAVQAVGGPAPYHVQRQAAVVMARGDELGRFHWGSTVIVLTGTHAPAWSPVLGPDQRIRLGAALSR